VEAGTVPVHKAIAPAKRGRGLPLWRSFSSVVEEVAEAEGVPLDRLALAEGPEVAGAAPVRTEAPPVEVQAAGPALAAAVVVGAARPRVAGLEATAVLVEESCLSFAIG
jgi:hypothetical protein